MIITMLTVLKTTIRAQDSTHIVMTFVYGKLYAFPRVLLINF